MGELKNILGNLPLSPKATFGIIFKLWELRYKYPEEYNDELFSIVAAEMKESPMLKQQQCAIDANSKYPGLNPVDITDRVMNITVGRVNAAVTMLNEPLSNTLKPFMENYQASVEDVRVIKGMGWISFDVTLSVSKEPTLEARHLFSAYDSYRHSSVLREFRQWT